MRPQSGERHRERKPVRKAAPAAEQPQRAQDDHRLLDLQRSAGNAAVVAFVQTPSGSSGGAAPLVLLDGDDGAGAGRAERGAGVQRETPPPDGSGTTAPTGTGTGAAPASLTVPASLLDADEDLVVTDTEAAASALAAVVIALHNEADTLDSTGEASLRSMAESTRAQMAKLTAAGPLSGADVGFLDGFLKVAASEEQAVIQASLQRLVDLFQQAQPAPEDNERVANLELDVAEALHQRYIGNEADEIKKLVELGEKLQSWNTKVGEYAGKVQEQSKRLQGIAAIASAAEKAKQLKEVSKELGEKIESAKAILEVVNDVATIAGAQGHPNGTAMMQGIDGFRAGIDLVDKTVGKFAERVPLFKDLWGKWYKPMVDACIAGLVKLAHLAEIRDRELATGMWLLDDSTGALQRDANGAPIISKLDIAKQNFPGGQAVFSYLYCLREGRDPPALTPEVKQYFLANRAIMNEIASSKSDELTSEWKLFSPSTWSTAGRETNLVKWLAGHWETVWSMLYGEIGANVPH